MCGNFGWRNLLESSLSVFFFFIIKPPCICEFEPSNRWMSPLIFILFFTSTISQNFKNKGKECFTIELKNSKNNFSNVSFSSVSLFQIDTMSCSTGKSLSEVLLLAEHVVYKNCSECQKQFLYNMLSPGVIPRFELGIYMYWTRIILWVSWCKNKTFRQRFTCNSDVWSFNNVFT